MLKRILKKIIISILTFEAKLILKKYQPKIIAITGSVGKTSTKDAVAAVLKSKFSVRESQKSYNSEIGVPLTIIGAETGWHKPSKWLAAIFKGMVLLLKKKKYPDILVLEMGADRPGDIERFAGWIKPRVVVMTALGEIPVHVEFFSGLEAVAKEKSKIIRPLGNDDWAIFNNDDKSVSEMRDKTKAGVLAFGMGEGADILGSNYHIIYRKDKKTELEIPEGITFKADFKGSSVPVRLTNTFGRHHVYAALAALAVGVSQNLNLVEISESLSLYSAPPGRLKLIEGIKNSWILDDTYNASPIAAQAALDVLAEMTASPRLNSLSADKAGGAGRKIAVLGDMLELGRYAIEAHRQVGRKVSGIADLVFLVGPRSKFIAEVCREKGMAPEKIYEFSDAREAGKKLQNIIEDGDLILIKGSQSMRMERAVEEIMAHPEEKEKLLVRQEKEWQKK